MIHWSLDQYVHSLFSYKLDYNSGFRKLHSGLLSLHSQPFSVSLVQAVVCDCLSQLEVCVSELSNCEHWAIFLDGFLFEKSYFI